MGVQSLTPFITLKSTTPFLSISQSQLPPCLPLSTGATQSLIQWHPTSETALLQFGPSTCCQGPEGAMLSVLQEVNLPLH